MYGIEMTINDFLKGLKTLLLSYENRATARLSVWKTNLQIAMIQRDSFR